MADPAARRLGGALLATLALLASVGFLVATYSCAVSRVAESAPGEAAAPQECIAKLHPAAVGSILLSLAALVATARDDRRFPLVAGIAGLLVSIPFVFSGGPMLALVSLLILAAGLALPARPPAGPRRQPRHA